jgi:ribosome-associated translation inhibitor RaiA/cold shock CspA family protein
MQVPLEIAFQHIEPSEAIEGQIRDRVTKLERLYGRMTSCRVHIDQTARNSNDTVPPVVRIEIGVPGSKDIVVSHEPDRLQRRFQTPDIRNAIKDAFGIAERQLVELKNQRTRRTKQPMHDEENQFLGQVAEVLPGEDHGFILTNEGGSLYFHRNGVLIGDFDKLRRGDEVHYVEEVGDTGPIAVKVRVKNHKLER